MTIRVPRGGLPMAVMLSNYTNIPMSLKIHDLNDYKHVIIVDDIYRFGKTVDKVLEVVKVPTTIITYGMHSGSLTRANQLGVHYKVVKDNTTIWFTFPWEPFDTETEVNGTKI